MKFSIITPSFNQGSFIGETIEGVLHQNFEEFEHIIVDGGSTDTTIEVIKRYPHLRWVSEPDKGQSDAVCKGIGMASGDIIGWINSDDFYYPGAFRSAEKIFQDNPHIGIVSADYNFVNETGQVLRTRREVVFDSDVYLYARKCYLANCAMFFRADLLRQYGGPRVELQYSMDYELELRLSAHAKFAHVREVWGCYRLHSASKTVADKGATQGENHQVQLEFLRKKHHWPTLEAPTLLHQMRGRLALIRRILRKAWTGCYSLPSVDPRRKTA